MSTPKRPDRIALELPEPLRKGLDELAKKTGRTRSEEIRECIRQRLEREAEREHPNSTPLSDFLTAEIERRGPEAVRQDLEAIGVAQPLREMMRQLTAVWNELSDPDSGQCP
jgi:hypothetical protein